MTTRKPSPARDVVKLTDLAPRQEIKGGSQRRIFGSDPIRSSPAKRAAPAGARPDRDVPLKPSGGMKGGGISRNDNITLLRLTDRRRRRQRRGCHAKRV